MNFFFLIAYWKSFFINIFPLKYFGRAQQQKGKENKQKKKKKKKNKFINFMVDDWVMCT